MKTLILMRHAKSAWDTPSSTDMDRPLAQRGRETAPQMGAWLKAQGYSPDIALCSTAMRARETLDLIKPSLPKKIKIQLVPELYMAMPREMLDVVAKVPQEAATALMVGHNPGMANLASWLAGSGKSKLLAKLRAKFPTGAIAVLQFEAEVWSSVVGESGVLVDFSRPRDLAE